MKISMISYLEKVRAPSRIESARGSVVRHEVVRDAPLLRSDIPSREEATLQTELVLGSLPCCEMRLGTELEPDELLLAGNDVASVLGSHRNPHPWTRIRSRPFIEDEFLLIFRKSSEKTVAFKAQLLLKDLVVLNHVARTRNLDCAPNELRGFILCPKSQHMPCSKDESRTCGQLRPQPCVRFPEHLDLLRPRIAEATYLCSILADRA